MTKANRFHLTKYHMIWGKTFDANVSTIFILTRNLGKGFGSVNHIHLLYFQCINFTIENHLINFSKVKIYTLCSGSQFWRNSGYLIKNQQFTPYFGKLFLTTMYFQCILPPFLNCHMSNIFYKIKNKIIRGRYRAIVCRK